MKKTEEGGVGESERGGEKQERRKEGVCRCAGTRTGATWEMQCTSESAEHISPNERHNTTPPARPKKKHPTPSETKSRILKFLEKITGAKICNINVFRIPQTQPTHPRGAVTQFWIRLLKTDVKYLNFIARIFKSHIPPLVLEIPKFCEYKSSSNIHFNTRFHIRQPVYASHRKNVAQLINFSNFHL